MNTTCHAAAAALSALCAAAPAAASGPEDPPAEACPAAEACVLTYPAEFFARYGPVDALDMVARLPGFTLDEGAGTRGFGGAGGNVLVDGERPSAKAASLADVLARIPASRVARVELIRGRAGGLEVQGQAVVANVVLRDGGPAATTWEAGADLQENNGEVVVFGSGSRTGAVGGVDFTAAFDGGETAGKTRTFESVVDGAGAALEGRDELYDNGGRWGQLSLNTRSRVGETVIRLNGLGYHEDFGGREISVRTPAGAAEPTGTVRQNNDRTYSSFEFGGDLERALTDAASMKLIALHRVEERSVDGLLDRPDDSGPGRIVTRTTSESTATESILRLELDHSGRPGHAIKLSAEAALNTLDSRFALTLDDGAGPEPQMVPGADSRVEETRADARLTDTVTFGRFVAEFGAGAEASTIRQTGDVGAERSFFFLKPTLSLTYAPDSRRQLRVRALREAAQLDFFEFVSSTDLGDDELELGNPDLSPETTWITDAAYERRFGEIGVVSLTVFHHWISDVQDLTPLGGVLEAPGNIGDGRRWGADVDVALPLDAAGLAGARLDVAAQWQDSTVVDPVTGLNRALTGEEEWTARIELRQDLDGRRVAWGGSLEIESWNPFFGLDELDRYKTTPHLGAFVESRRWFGLTTRFEIQNILDEGDDRERTVFDGPRGLSPVAFRELRDRDRGRQYLLTLTGDF